MITIVFDKEKKTLVCAVI